MKKFLKRLAINFSLSSELSDEEKLKFLTKEEKHDNLLADIRAIRNNGFYVPNYDKPNPHAILACPRPVDFGNDVEAWIKAVKDSNKKDLETKEIRKEQNRQRKLLIEVSFAPHIMSRFLKVD